MTLPPHYEFRRLDDLVDGLGTFKATFDRNDSPKSIEHLRWQFEQLPLNNRYVTLAFSGPASAREPAAGLYAVFPSRTKVGDATRVCVQSLDTLTDRDHRGRGLFLQLASNVYDQCARDDVAFVYGFPNKNSAPGFFGRLNWIRLDPVPFLVKPLRASYFLRRLGLSAAATLPFSVRTPRLPAGDAFVAFHEFGAGADAVWKDFRQDVGVGLERDADYLNWRFTRRPSNQYRSWEYVRSGGDSVGFVTVCCLDKHGGRVGYIMELLYRRGDTTAGVALLRRAVASLAEDGAEVVLAWNLAHSPNHPAFRKAGFFFLPEQLRPIELHFGIRAIDPSIREIVGDRTNWYLSYADSDTV